MGDLGHYEMPSATKMIPVSLSYELQMFRNPFHGEPEAESGLSGFRMFQDVSRCFGIGNLGHYEMTRHQNEPDKPVIRATTVWKPIS